MGTLPISEREEAEEASERAGTTPVVKLVMLPP